MNAWRQVWSENKREIIIFVLAAVAIFSVAYYQIHAPPTSEEEAHAYDMTP